MGIVGIGLGGGSEDQDIGFGYLSLRRLVGSQIVKFEFQEVGWMEDIYLGRCRGIGVILRF